MELSRLTQLSPISRNDGPAIFLIDSSWTAIQIHSLRDILKNLLFNLLEARKHHSVIVSILYFPLGETCPVWVPRKHALCGYQGNMSWVVTWETSYVWLPGKHVCMCTRKTCPVSLPGKHALCGYQGNVRPETNNTFFGFNCLLACDLIICERPTK